MVSLTIINNRGKDTAQFTFYFYIFIFLFDFLSTACSVIHFFKDCINCTPSLTHFFYYGWDMSGKIILLYSWIRNQKFQPQKLLSMEVFSCNLIRILECNPNMCFLFLNCKMFDKPWQVPAWLLGNYQFQSCILKTYQLLQFDRRKIENNFPVAKVTLESEIYFIYTYI